MCRWLGYLGSPIEPRELLYDPERSLIEQSRRHAPTWPCRNGDGFGLGWYGRREVAAIFHSATPGMGGPQPAHAGLGDLLAAVLAHVRAATGTPVQETNCHPFAMGPMDVRPQRLRRRVRGPAPRHAAGGAARPVPEHQGTTDSELLFHLALTFGLRGGPDRRPRADGRVRGVARCGRRDRRATADDGRRQRRGAAVGRPVRGGTGREHPLLQRGRRVAARALPGEASGSPSSAPTRVWSSPSR